jgi:3-oxoacyl-[acyl-carrier protein] reductase
LDSLFYLTKEILPDIRKSDAGRIINITSVTGPVMAMRNEIGYASAKAAVSGFTRALALDEAQYGITVNAIAPGWIATDSQSDHERGQGLKTPMKRSGKPEEIASAIIWLASKESGYITGQTIVIDGGNSIAEERGD